MTALQATTAIMSSHNRRQLWAGARDFLSFIWVEDCGAVPEVLLLTISTNVSAQCFQLSGQNRSVLMDRTDLIVLPNGLGWSVSFFGLVDGFRDREAPEGILQCDQRQKSDQGQC